MERIVQVVKITDFTRNYRNVSLCHVIKKYKNGGPISGPGLGNMEGLRRLRVHLHKRYPDG